MSKLQLGVCLDKARLRPAAAHLLPLRDPPCPRPRARPFPPLPPPLPRSLLDPQLATSYPSAILARERAIVVNLEFIKCIIGMGGCTPGLRGAGVRVPVGAPGLLLLKVLGAGAAAPAATRTCTLPSLLLLPYVGVSLSLELQPPGPSHSYITQSTVLAQLRPPALSLVYLPATDNVYITNLEDQNTLLFVEELQVAALATRRLQRRGCCRGLQPPWPGLLPRAVRLLLLLLLLLFTFACMVAAHCLLCRSAQPSPPALCCSGGCALLTPPPRQPPAAPRASSCPSPPSTWPARRVGRGRGS